MASPNEPAERLNRTVAHVEDNILPWLKGRLRRAQQDERYGSPDDARQEKSSIKIVAEFYQDKLKTLADEVAANGISLPADQGRFGKVNQKLDKIVDQTENVRPRIDGPKVARGPEWSSGRSIS